MKEKPYLQQSSTELTKRARTLLDYLSVCLSHLMVFADAARTPSHPLAPSQEREAHAWVVRELDQASTLDRDIKAVLHALKRVLERETGRYDPASISPILQTYAGYGDALKEIQAMGLAPEIDFPPTPTGSNLNAAAAAFPSASTTSPTSSSSSPLSDASPSSGGGSRVGNFFRYFYPGSGSTPQNGEGGGEGEDEGEGQELEPLLAPAPGSAGSAGSAQQLVAVETDASVLRLETPDGGVLELKEVPYSERQAAEDAAARAHSLEDIERDMEELHEMFLDISAMVAEGGEMLDVVDHNLEEAQVIVDEGVRELSIASRLAHFGLPLIGAGVGGLLFGPVGAAAGAKGASALAISAGGAGLGWASVKTILKRGRE